MALPTVVRTWQKNLDNAQLAQGTALANTKLVFLNIKNALLGFATPLVVDYSCDGTTAGTKADGVDRITTVAKIVYASGAGAHSWIVLKMTGINSGAEILFDFNSNAGNGNTITTSLSTTVGFTGGSTTAAPTASDSAIISAHTNSIFGINIDTALRWSVWLSTDLAAMKVVVVGSGNVYAVWDIQVPTNVVTGWTNPWFSLMQDGTVTVGSGTGGITSLSAYQRARISGGTANMTMLCEGPSGNLLPADTNFGHIANEVSGDWYFAPIGIGSYTIGVRGRHASLVDLWMGSNSVSSGDSYPSSGTTGQFAQFGNLIVPWNNGPVHMT